MNYLGRWKRVRARIVPNAAKSGADYRSGSQGRRPLSAWRSRRNNAPATGLLANGAKADMGLRRAGFVRGHS